MDRIDARSKLVPSLLDRLTEADTLDTRRGYSVGQMYDSVLRDLQDLLSTRCTLPELPAEFDRLSSSIAGYGIPDLTSLSILSERTGVKIGRTLADAIARFEPRLIDVRVVPVPDAGEEKQFRLKYRITARLSVEPYPDVAFQTVLVLTTGQATVEGGGPIDG